MLLDKIQRRCAESGTEDVCRVWPTNERLTGSELLLRANGLRDELSSLGLGEASRIGLSLPVGTDLFVAILAVWSLGASFVPIDPLEAEDRLGAIVRASRVGAILGSRANSALAAQDTITVAFAGGRVTAAEGHAMSPGARRPASEAYVIFTSGSTGTPKGVSVGHESIASYIESILDIYSVPESGILVPSQLPPTFDAALTTLLLPLVTRNIAVPIGDQASATKALASWLGTVTSPVMVKTTPSQLRILGQMMADEDLDNLAAHGATFIVGGGQPGRGHLRGRPSPTPANGWPAPARTGF